MAYQSDHPLHEFNHLVGVRYNMYNSLFTALPFQRIEKTGVFLSLFLIHCEEGYGRGLNPVEIIETFFEQNTVYTQTHDQVDLLFRFIQYCERQVVLFDALEDAAFPLIHNLKGAGTVTHLLIESKKRNRMDELQGRLEQFGVRLVLTAHPTQFYPQEVLGIIHDLAKALAQNNTMLANSYIEQLGKTPFFKKEKPTPYNEAVSQVWFLENIFYHSVGNILSMLSHEYPGIAAANPRLIQIGFWPGGDRDGNPFVKADTTLRVAAMLRNRILSNYLKDVAVLRRRLTFVGVAELIDRLEEILSAQLLTDRGIEGVPLQEQLMGILTQIKDVLVEQHNGLFIDLAENFICKLNAFGLHFASLDIRQDSSIHQQLFDSLVGLPGFLPRDYPQLTDQAKIQRLLQLESPITGTSFAPGSVMADTIESLSAIAEIQRLNGELGCHRYIISHTAAALHVIEVYVLLRTALRDPHGRVSMDIVPLFETIEDLQKAPSVMRDLYSMELYRDHLRSRNNQQTIMLGFSDSTKDGGYLMANWSIFKCKVELSALAAEHGIRVVFFDGRGGPPARGGGKTHQFYSSLGRDVANSEIHLTVQGQTISSNFGNIESAQFNIEQLIHAGIGGAVIGQAKDHTLTPHESDLLGVLAQISYETYKALRDHPMFLDYIAEITPLNYYSETNIASRPSRRVKGELSFDMLRAVPYVGSWSQVKQNIPGYYGVGSALRRIEAQGRFHEVEALYKESLYFKTLLDNCEMAMMKCFFPLTAYLRGHGKYAELWEMMHSEFLLTHAYILRLAGESELMADKPVAKESVQMRQRIELPLLTIQQYAIMTLNELLANGRATAEERSVYEKLIVRCSFGIINAERNSA